MKINYSKAIGTLGLTKGASKNQIRKAFRSLSKKYHPDVYPIDSGQKFLIINEAYQFLKRNQYQEAVDGYDNAAYRSARATTSRNAEDTYAYAREAWRAQQRTARRHREYKMHVLMKKMVHAARPFMLFALALNILLAADFLLPYEKISAKLLKKELVLDNKEYPTDRVRLFFNNELTFTIRDTDAQYIEEQLNYEVVRTLLLNQRKKIQQIGSDIYISGGLNAVNNFAFIILIQLIAVFRYKMAARSEAKLSTIIVSAFCTPIQLFLLFTSYAQ